MSNIRKKICRHLLFLFILQAVILIPALHAEDSKGTEVIPPTAVSSPITAAEPAKPDKKADEKYNVNVDAQLLYGQYNNIFSTISLIQNNKTFAYQLNSEFKRSNDFGYKNSSFYNNEFGFTGKADLNKTWTFIPEINVNNESHGMFDNTVFSREEKDKIVVFFKNEYKPTPARWYFNFGGAHYVHRLNGADPISFSAYKLNEEIKWEYIWSASNSIAIRHYYWQYFYKDVVVENDSHIANELLLNFKLTEYVKLTGGAIIDWNRDSGWFPSGKVLLSSTGLKYFSFEGTYAYTLNPFQPEDLYFNQKYIEPKGSLPPSKMHKGTVDSSFDISFKKNSSFHVKKIKFKVKGVWERHSSFYNYIDSAAYSNGRILDVVSQGVTTLYSDSSLLLIFSLFRQSLKLNTTYRYQYFDSNNNITYRPAHLVTWEIAYKYSRWEFAWKNKYQGSVYVDTSTATKLKSVITADLQLQYRMINTLYLNVKLQNLYNNSYSIINSYPEPGFTALVGLRIVI